MIFGIDIDGYLHTQYDDLGQAMIHKNLGTCQWEIMGNPGSEQMEVRVYVPSFWPYELWGMIPSGYVKIAIENGKMVLEIVHFPIENAGSFHCDVSLPEGILGTALPSVDKL